MAPTNSLMPVPDPTARYVIRTGVLARSSKTSMTFQKNLDGFVVPDPCISIVVAAAEEVTAAAVTARAAQKRQKERKRRTRRANKGVKVIVFPAAAIATMMIAN